MSQEPFFSSVNEFVVSSGGDHAISKILVANNGIGAVKAIRSIRRWSFETFGDEKKITFVVMATPEDMRANAEFIRLADEVVDVPGGSNNNNYANVNLICEVAERLEVDAVMPMWGHASENPSLPSSLLRCRRKISFIGPPAEPMQALGDKIGSTIIAQSAGVPTIAWNGDGLVVDYKATGIPQDIYDKANVTTADEAMDCCLRIGFPVMIKASEGGGGKGIRKVTRVEDVVPFFRQVQGEVPGSPIFVMKMASGARHLEVQLLADKYGEAIALSGRDCSIQRRHQKIVEEGPPIAAEPSVFREMEKSAVALAKTVGYCSCGTVEFLYVDETHKFAFLELNPRLQVEHPVTENILGLNLPACQLQVAMGLPLYRIRDIRRLYGRHPAGRDTIDFEFSERCAPPRHCIAVRITAENPDAGFQPTSGKFKELQFRSAVDVWGYFSVNSSGLIHEFADSQFGHVFASGRDRESARRAMIVALKELDIRGDISTTTQYIIRMMQTEDYINNHIDTAWLDLRIARHKEVQLENLSSDPHHTLVAVCGAALKGFKHFDSRSTLFRDMLSVGQVPPQDTLSQSVGVDLIYQNIKYKIMCILSGPSSVIVECGGASEVVSIRKQSDGGHLLNVRGKSHMVYSQDLGDSGGLRIILDGFTCTFTPEYDPTRLVSTVAGKLARLLVSDGSHVSAGSPYVEIEVMKMYMPLRTIESGVVRFMMSEGASLAPGDLLAIMELDDPERVVKAEEFKGQLLEDEGISASIGRFPHIIARESLRTLDKIFEGYFFTEDAAAAALSSFLRSINDPILPSFEIEDALSVLRGRIPTTLYSSITEINATFRERASDADKALGGSKHTPVRSGSFHVGLVEYPADTVLTLLNDYIQSVEPDKIAAVSKLTGVLWTVAETYLYPPSVRTLVNMLRLTENYLNVEKLFDNMSFADVVSSLRKEFQTDLDKIVSLCLSHVNLPLKNFIMLKVIDIMMGIQASAAKSRPKVPKGVPLRLDMNIRNLKVRLTELSKLRQGVYSRISFAANLGLMEQNTLSIHKRREKLQDALVAALTTGDEVGSGERVVCLTKFVEGNVAIRDLFFESLTQDRDYAVAFMELYLRKVYQKTHHMKNMSSGYYLSGDKSQSSPWLKFDFITRAVEAVQLMASQSPRTDTYAISYSDLAAITHLVRANSSGGVDSDSEMDGKGKEYPSGVHRSGLFVVVDSCDDMERLFLAMLQQLSLQPHQSVSPLRNTSPKNVLDIAVLKTSMRTEDEQAAYFQTFLQKNEDALVACGVRRVSFVVDNSYDEFSVGGSVPLGSGSGINPLGINSSAANIFTYRARTHFSEDNLFRHIESAQAFHLDLMRLDNFDITLVNGVQTSSGTVQLYMAIEKGYLGVKNSSKTPIRRYYARLVTFTSDAHSSDAEALFVESLDTMALAIGNEEQNEQLKKYFKHAPSSSANHIFLNIVAPEAVIQPDSFEGELRRICTKYSQKMVRLSVATVEFKLTCRLVADADPLFIRLVASNPTGYVLKIESYYEAIENGRVVFHAINSSGKQSKGSWDGQLVSTPYPVSERFEAQRAEALMSSDTLYVYDWPILFEKAADDIFEQFTKDKIPGPLQGKESLSPSIFSCEELVLCQANSSAHSPIPLSNDWTAAEGATAVLMPTTREPGGNSAGMVAWLATLRSPECPSGRQFVILANDITHNAGSFGTKEDVMFYKVSEYCRIRGIPRLYLAANSGARIGMAQSLKSKFKVCWTDETDPGKGFQYIYLSKPDYETMLGKYKGVIQALPVICDEIVDSATAETRYMITDIIGEEPDLGVENLMGSGLIAGETAKAYDEVFTLTLVVGRTVGIGAYLVRLGQRTIQKTRSSPIILTGYQALNKLMGREIYTSNDQLGGPMIMFPNGVSHLLADTHLDCVHKALTWLSFVPPVKGGNLPIRDLALFGYDQVDRPVNFVPEKNIPYDPRHLLNGHVIKSLVSGVEQWVSGFFDRNSFVETLGGWAKTVVVGRARLGGIPMGVIVTENRTAEATKPADPADVTSAEKLVQQAGGVWFPDSAYKTAQALRDFNREDLPCIIFANWRGFSGGQRDMFDEVLKFGSMIVDALVAYQQPLFVYIPPHAELRGGAWVVVDSTINADVMEFYAAEHARGGVLEATGAVAIKFRDRDLRSAAHRLDQQLLALDAKLASLKADVNAEGRVALMEEISRQILQRERSLLGVYQQIAVHFADLHDTPGRMQRKGVIRRQVNWSESRTYFYWRLRRRLIEFDVSKTIERMNLDSGVPDTNALGVRFPTAVDNLTSSWSSNIVNTKHTKTAACTTLKSWFVDTGGNASVWDTDDRRVVTWLNDNQQLLKEKLLEMKKASLANSLKYNFLAMCETASVFSSLKDSKDADASEIAEKDFMTDIFNISLQQLGDSNKAKVIDALRKMLKI